MSGDDMDDDLDQEQLTVVANRLNELMAGRTSAQAEAALATLDADDPADELPRKIGERVVRALHEFDGAAIEELFSDGLLNVMAAPEFAQSEKPPSGQANQRGCGQSTAARRDRARSSLSRRPGEEGGAADVGPRSEGIGIGV